MPAEARLAGWAWLVHRLGVQGAGPLLERCLRSARQGEFPEGGRGGRSTTSGTGLGDGFGDHLGFALRHENLDLLVLKRLYDAVPQDSITVYVRSAPTGAHNRRAWFLYEFLTGRMLDIEDAAEAGFTDLLDNRVYFTGAPVPPPPP